MTEIEILRTRVMALESVIEKIIMYHQELHTLHHPTLNPPTFWCVEMESARQYIVQTHLNNQQQEQA